ncbi:MAG: hypothetical protein JOZ07_19135 [Solirubrobacterales bacterium]|nr:hypothetical protein [Solirubrobacterales bacterium]
MRIHRPTPITRAETIVGHSEQTARWDDAERAARAWTRAGFDDATMARWLRARCFEPAAARALADLGVAPEQAAVRSREGGSIDTIAGKVAAGVLTARQGAARALSSR